METLNLCDIYNACGINRLYPQNRANCVHCISRLCRSVQQNTFCRLRGTPPGKQWLLYPNAQQRSCPGSAQEIEKMKESKKFISEWSKLWCFCSPLGVVSYFLFFIEGTRAVETTMALSAAVSMSDWCKEWLKVGCGC